MTAKKSWCRHKLDAACNCEPEECLADVKRGMLGDLNALLDYGLSVDEIVEDVKEGRK